MTAQQIMTPNEVRASLGLPPEIVHATISDKPWSDYSESDYSIEQWHNACLIHLHDGTPTSKAQCKLPIRTPNGMLNKNGIQAAAGALAGARGGVQAPDDQKQKAARALARFYSQMNMQIPDGMSSMMQSDIDAVADFLAHYGKKGMRWGVRKDVVGLTSLAPGGRGQVAVGDLSRGKTPPTREEAQQVGMATTQARDALLNSKTGPLAPGGTIAKLNETHRATLNKRNPTDAELKSYDDEFTRLANAHMAKFMPPGIAARVHIQGDNMLLFVGHEADVKSAIDDFVRHDAITISFTIVRDETGAIVDIQEDSMEQMDPVSKFLMHYGRKGMKWGQRIFSRNKGTVEPAGSPGAGGTKKPATAEDSATPAHLSADAERFIRTHQKAGVEMSDREIKEAIQRANIVKQYDDLFNTGPNAELKAKVEALALQKQYAELQAAMRPPGKIERVNKFLDTANKGFEAYNKLNKATGGSLNNKLAKQFEEARAASKATKTEREALKTTFDAARAAKAARDASAGRHKVGAFPPEMKAPRLGKHRKG